LKIASYSVMAALAGWQRAGQVTVGLERSAAADLLRAIRRQVRGLRDLWMYRAGVARETIAGQSIARWPSLLKQKWAGRASARPMVFPGRS
jgi:hypothetical protein